MLTKDLLLFKFKKNEFIPQFIDENSDDLIQMINELYSIYNDGIGFSRNELDTFTDIVVKGAKQQKIALGINKLLLDNCKFEVAGNFDYPEERKKLFLGLTTSSGFLDGDIYGDLAGNEHLVEVPSLKAIELIQRYNLSQVQGLIFYSKNIEVSLISPKTQELRRLLQCLKFFRLLAEIKVEKNIYKLKLSGPASIFSSSRKYALQLAAFFPFIVKMSNWSVVAEIELQNKNGKLKIDSSTLLQSHYRNISGYIPEEIRLFYNLFKEKSKNWQIIEGGKIIDNLHQELIFPDFSFKSTSKNSDNIYHLELFHQWHKSQFEKRLEFIKENPSIPLILGVDRSILNDNEFDLLIKSNPELKDHLLRFRNFPGVERCQNSLDKLSIL